LGGAFLKEGRWIREPGEIRKKRGNLKVKSLRDNCGHTSEEKTKFI